MADSTSTKAAVRALVLGQRRAMSPADRAAADSALVSHVLRFVDGLTTVAAHVPMPGEPGGEDLVAALGAAVPTLLLPRVRPDRDLSWIAYEGGLGPCGAFGLC